MKHIVLTIGSMLIAGSAFAQTQATPPAAPSTPPAKEAKAAPAKMSFEERKKMMLQHMQEHQSCVQAATDEAALKACRPKHVAGHDHHKMMGSH